MMKLIKKSLIIILLVTIDVTIYLLRIIHDFFIQNKSKIKNYSKSFYNVLKEELTK